MAKETQTISRMYLICEEKMQEEKKPLERNSYFCQITVGAVFFMLLYYGCNSLPKRNFFQGMKDRYEPILIDSSVYFLKHFGLSSKPISIQTKTYWEIYGNEESYFFLPGFIRLKQDSIVYIPFDWRTSNQITEYKLFDFTATRGSYWLLYLSSTGSSLYGDSIVYKTSYHKHGDLIYGFSVFPFRYYKLDGSKTPFLISFKVEVSKMNGIVSIYAMDASQKISLFYCTLYPKEQFIDMRTDIMPM